jgi:hypothetical protein
VKANEYVSAVEREQIKALRVPGNVTREYWRFVDGDPGKPRIEILWASVPWLRQRRTDRVGSGAPAVGLRGVRTNLVTTRWGYGKPTFTGGWLFIACADAMEPAVFDN